MTRPIIRIHDISLDEIIDREMNDEEFAQYNLELKQQAIKQAELDSQIAAKQAVLDRVGITAEEAALLLK
jgi:hypothetical protein